jgi:taurine--2-oxoglutarate transaminase
VELVKNRDSRAPLVGFGASGAAAAPMQDMMKFAMEAGLYLSYFSNITRLTPPLNISTEDIDFAVEILDRMVAISDRLAD